MKAPVRGMPSPLSNRLSLDARDRPTSAYVPQQQQVNYSAGQVAQQQPIRSQSQRDIISAKMQEMQEEVRRRELRGAAQFRASAYYNPTRQPISPAGAPIAAMRSSGPIGTIIEEWKKSFCFSINFHFFS